MEIAALVWRGETRVTPSVSFSLPPRRRAFSPDGDLGSSFRPFPGRCPRSNGSAREPSGSDVAGRRETPAIIYLTNQGGTRSSARVRFRRGAVEDGASREQRAILYFFAPRKSRSWSRVIPRLL